MPKKNRFIIIMNQSVLGWKCIYCQLDNNNNNEKKCLLCEKEKVTLNDNIETNIYQPIEMIMNNDIMGYFSQFTNPTDLTNLMNTSRTLYTNKRDLKYDRLVKYFDVNKKYLENYSNIFLANENEFTELMNIYNKYPSKLERLTHLSFGYELKQSSPSNLTSELIIIPFTRRHVCMGDNPHEFSNTRKHLTISDIFNKLFALHHHLTHLTINGNYLHMPIRKSSS